MNGSNPQVVVSGSDEETTAVPAFVPTERVTEIAAELNGCEYGSEGSKDLWATMKAEGLVAVFGASDDLVEMRGAIDDEASAYDGTTVLITEAGLFERCECDCKYSLAAQKVAIEIDALWDAGDGEPAWTYEVDFPHATFNVFEGGEVYCRGIVFALSQIHLSGDA